MRSKIHHKSAGLTLIELVVVLVVLIVLAGLVLPRITGIASQASYATNASIISDVNKAVSTYETRNSASPNGWDGILDTSGNFPTTTSGSTTTQLLYPALLNTSDATLPILSTVALDNNQVASLTMSGITGIHFSNISKAYGGLPSNMGVDYLSIAQGVKLATLVVPTASSSPPWTAHGSTFADRAFNLSPFATNAQETFVVFGIGQPCSLRGSALQDSPIVQSATPTKYYARVLVVYQIPASGAAAAYPARFIGSFLPDGTSMNDNVASYTTNVGK